MDLIEKIEDALKAHGLRQYFGAIDDNPQSIEGPEVVLWIAGNGRPVHSVEEALKVVYDYAAR